LSLPGLIYGAGKIPLSSVSSSISDFSG
jgi:hypothetical protein